MPVFSAIAATIGTIASSIGAAGSGVAGAGAATAGAAGTAAGAGGLAAGIGAAAGAIGVGAQVFGTVQAAAAQKEQAKLAETAEQTKLAQVNFENQRQVRGMVRQGLLARSQALVNANAQGAQEGSGLQGGFGQIAGQTGTNIVGANAQAGFGRAIYGINSQIARAQASEANGRAIAGFGGQLVQNQDMFGRLGAYGFGSIA